MSIKHSVASKARWENISPKERTQRMRRIAVKRQSMLTAEQRRDNAMRMVEARNKKRAKK